MKYRCAECGHEYVTASYPEVMLHRVVSHSGKEPVCSRTSS